MARCILVTALLIGAFPCNAQDGYEISYASPREALTFLRNEPDATVESRDGWTVVNVERNSVRSRWTFTPEDHPAHPGVIKLTSFQRDGETMVATDMLCETPIDVCDALLQQVILGRVSRRIITPENAEAYGYSVELQPRDLPHLYNVRIEFPKTRESGYEYGHTNVELQSNGDTLLLWRVQSYDVAGSSNRLFFSLTGSKAWLACLKATSSFHASSATQTATTTESYSTFEINPVLFLESAGEHSSSATQACREASLGE